MGTTSATVETLTAEVRVLMVGNRQITLSVAKQLDRIDWPYSVEELHEFTAFGRVRTGVMIEQTHRLTREPRRVTDKHWYEEGAWYVDVLVTPTVELIGKREADGSLVLFTACRPVFAASPEEMQDWATLVDLNSSLPLIVLAGLR